MLFLTFLIIFVLLSIHRHLFPMFPGFCCKDNKTLILKIKI